MYATSNGTVRYASRYAEYRDAGFYRTILDLQVSSLGIGTYLGELLPGPATAAQRAIQFTRSTPGIAVALVGMGRPEHVQENLGVAHRPLATAEEYLRLYR
jgi:hypothetical protein